MSCWHVAILKGKRVSAATLDLCLLRDHAFCQPHLVRRKEEGRLAGSEGRGGEWMGRAHTHTAPAATPTDATQARGSANLALETRSRLHTVALLPSNVAREAHHVPEDGAVGRLAGNSNVDTDHADRHTDTITTPPLGA